MFSGNKKSNFEGKVVLITGGSMGIGKACVEAFASANANVIFCARREEEGKKLERIINEKESGNCSFIKCDVADAKSVEKMVKEVIRSFGKIDILINNAGTYLTGNLIDTSEAEWDKIMAVNLKSIYLCSHYVLPAMIEKGKGVIVNIGSEAGLIAVENQAAYNASKAAVHSLTQSMAVNFAKKGIRVNCVSPGITDTPLVGNALSKADNPEAERKKVEALRPLNRLARPGEIAAAILFLASDEIGYATGAVLVIDGGYTIYKEGI